MQTIASTTKFKRRICYEKEDDLHAIEKIRVVRSQECVRILLE